MEFTILMHDEAVRLDPEPLSALHKELGPAGAENVISRALEELSLRMADLRRHCEAGDRFAAAKLARSLVAIGAQVGMTRFATVAKDVSGCAAGGDDAALGATLARLERLADQSLMAMWDLQDMRL